MSATRSSPSPLSSTSVVDALFIPRWETLKRWSIQHLRRIRTTWRGDDRWPLVPGSPRRSRLVTPSDDLRAHHPAGCYSWVASRPDSAGSAGWSRREALALAGAGSQPPWELDLRRSLRLRQTSSPPRFQAERPGDHDGGEHYAARCRGPRSRDTPSSSKMRVGSRGLFSV